MTDAFALQPPAGVAPTPVAECSAALVRALQSNLAPLRSMLIRRVGNEDDALDLLQDTYLRCAELTTGTTIGNPRSYVWRLALNLVIDYQRSQARSRRVYCGDDDALRSATAPTASPEDNTAVLAMLDAFQRVIEELPAECRRAYVLSRRDGLTYDDIAREMGVSSNMVKKHIKRALAVLRSQLAA